MNNGRIGDVFEYISRGKSPQYVDQSSVHVINQACIRWDGIDFSKVKYQNPTTIKIDAILSVGDLLISSTGTGTLGRCCVFDGGDESITYVADSHVTVVRKSNIVLPSFAKYYLMHDETQRELYAQCVNGSTNQIELSKEKFKKFLIPVPSREVQQSIVTILEKIEELIALRKTQLEKLDQLIKSRFIELFGDPVKNDMGWESKPLNDVCDGIGDGLHGTPVYDEDGEYPFINGNNLIEGEIVITPATKTVSEETYQKHLIEISPNAILISINGTLGKLAFYNGEKVMLGKSACYCNLKQSINKMFVYGVMKSNAFAEFLENSSTKSTIKNVGLKAMREFKLILPPTELQERYTAFAEQTDKSKLAIQASLEKLELLKKSLMQQYFG